MARSAGGAALARTRAREILAEGRFHAAPLPRPLHGLLHTLGTALESPLHALGKLVSRVAVVTPGGAAVVWGVLAAALLALSATLAARRARRALADPGAHGAQSGVAAAPSARELERDAAAAEAQGRLADAVRLRFRAGLLGLAERQLLDAAPSMLNAEIALALHSERFDALARAFEEIAYGGRRAVAQDVERARAEWSRLLRSRGRE